MSPSSLYPVTGGEQVPEVVRNAAGKPAHRLHPVGVAQLDFEGTPLAPFACGGELALDGRRQP